MKMQSTCESISRCSGWLQPIIHVRGLREPDDSQKRRRVLLILCSTGMSCLESPGYREVFCTSSKLIFLHAESILFWEWVYTATKATICTSNKKKKKSPLLRQWGILIGWAETVEEATRLPLSLTVCLCLSESCICLEFGLNRDLNDFRWKWRVRCVEWRHGGVGGVGFLKVWSLSAPPVAKRAHNTQAVALKHPTRENYTKHSVRAHFLSHRGRAVNLFHSWAQCVSLMETYILHHMRVCCFRPQSDTPSSHLNSIPAYGVLYYLSQSQGNPLKWAACCKYPNSEPIVWSSPDAGDADETSCRSIKQAGSNTPPNP